MRKSLVAFLAVLIAMVLMLTGCKSAARTFYTVEYYYDGIMDDSKTFTAEGDVGEVITLVPDEAGSQYEIDSETPSNLPFTLTSNPDDNIVKIYYIIRQENYAQEIPENFPNGAGNTLNNLANNGYAVEQGDWIYYIYCSGLFVTSFDGIYKMRLNGSEKTKLFDGYCSSLNIAGDWLYFASSISEVIRMKIDGTSCAVVCEGSSPTYLDGWIYYLSYYREESTYTFCKVRPDGTENTKIFDNASSLYLIVDGQVYFYNYSKSEIYKIKLDGTSKIVVRDNIKNCSSFIIDGDWLYYSEALGELEMHVDNHQIYKMRLDGSQHNAVKKTTYSNGDFGVLNNKLYYSSYDSYAGNGGWYQANLDGSSAVALDSRFSGRFINFAGGWMIAGFGELSMLRLDGSDFYNERHNEV